MTALLGQVERLLERAFEAPARLLFRTRLQPVEVARAVGRAMAADSQVGPEGLQVPNQYQIGLHPDDFRRFESWREALEHDLAAYVVQQVQRRGWRCPGWPEVAVEADAAVARGRPRITTNTVEPRLAPAGQPGPAAPGALGATAVVQPVAVGPRPAPRASGRAWLELDDGRIVDLAAPLLRIGRARDNDLALDHDSVSRYHAQVRRVAGAVLIADLGSTNGTRVNGESVGEQRLLPGDLIHVGAVPARFHAGD